MTDDEVDEQLVEDAAEMSADPLAWAHYAYEWGAGELAGDGAQELRTWQAESFAEIRDHLTDPVTRFQPKRMAVASGHGIGKSAFIGMLCNWAMSTCEDTRIVVTANTENQLRTKTWPEISKWTRLSITSPWWSVPGMSMYSSEPGREKSWRADATPWSENNTEAFAGLHNKGKRIVLVFDEASKIADKVWEVAEGALTDANTEIIWLAFGNPTQAGGRFRECFRRYRHLWSTRHIDSRSVEGTNKTYLDEFVATHGEDSDIVKVRVRGMFPAMSIKQFISADDVDQAFGREIAPASYNFAPKILTLDNAWEGDDEGVIGMRQGLKFRVLHTFAKNDNDWDVATKLAALEDEHQAAAVHIDAGYGTGVVSAGKTMGRKWRLVWFSGESPDAGCLNLRAFMAKETRDWLKAGGCIDSDQVLYSDLTSIETVPRPDGKIQLEAKKDMKKRGLPSPGRADALFLSFAAPVRHAPAPPPAPIPMVSHFARR